MTRILELVISLLIVVVLFVVVGLILPSHAHVERTVELANPTSQVYDLLNGFRRYNSWQPWAGVDPHTTYSREGPEFGVGAKFNFASFEKRVGTGSIEIVESVPNERIRMAMTNTWYGTNKVFEFNLEPDNRTRSTLLTYSLDVDYGWNLFGRYAGMYLNGGVGEYMSSGLSRFQNLMATIPILDYSQIEIQLVDVPVVDLLYVGSTLPHAPRQWDEASEAMDKAWAEIEGFISRNKLVRAGPNRRIINVLGEDNDDFNMAVPIEPAEVTVSGNVRTKPGYAGQALVTVLQGHRVGMNKPREMLKAYALTHGYRFSSDLEGAFEEWLPDANAEGQSVTNVYLPVTL